MARVGLIEMPNDGRKRVCIVGAGAAGKPASGFL